MYSSAGKYELIRFDTPQEKIWRKAPGLNLIVNSCVPGIYEAINGSVRIPQTLSSDISDMEFLSFLKDIYILQLSDKLIVINMVKQGKAIIEKGISDSAGTFISQKKSTNSISFPEGYEILTLSVASFSNMIFSSNMVDNNLVDNESNTKVRLVYKQIGVKLNHFTLFTKTNDDSG